MQGWRRFLYTNGFNSPLPCRYGQGVGLEGIAGIAAAGEGRDTTHSHYLYTPQLMIKSSYFSKYMDLSSICFETGLTNL